MTDSGGRKTEGPAGARGAREARSILVPWDETSESERDLLLRVESLILDRASEIPEEKASLAGGVSLADRMGWGSAWAAAAIALVLVGTVAWLLWPRAVVLPPLRAKGEMVSTPLPKMDGSGRRIQLTLRRNARLGDQQRWDVHSHADTRLRVVRSAPRVSVLHLQRGAVSIRVNPRAMKRFVVSCRDRLEVVVTGTKFLVWQGSSWIRVEVTRGEVKLRREGQELISLRGGQGVRIERRLKNLLQVYRVPKRILGWRSKMEWLAKQPRASIYSYARDLGEGTMLSASRRLQPLEMAAHALAGRSRWKQAGRLWQRIHQLQPRGYGAQTALFQAARCCRLSDSSRRSCGKLYRRFLERYPKGLPSLRRRSRYWSGLLTQGSR